jgi:hypothetical protein
MDYNICLYIIVAYIDHIYIICLISTVNSTGNLLLGDQKKVFPDLKFLTRVCLKSHLNKNMPFRYESNSVYQIECLSYCTCFLRETFLLCYPSECMYASPFTVTDQIAPNDE